MRKGEGIIPADGGQDGNNPPYPGVIIEEMFDSASQVGAPDDNMSKRANGHAEQYEVSCLPLLSHTTSDRLKKWFEYYGILSAFLRE